LRVVKQEDLNNLHLAFDHKKILEDYFKTR